VQGAGKTAPCISLTAESLPMKSSKVLKATKTEKRVLMTSVTENGTELNLEYLFLWNSGIRLIYQSAGRCTAWFLNKETGLWGCFADSLDIGFDQTIVADELNTKIFRNKKIGELSDAEFVKLERAVADRFFEIMLDHVEHIYPGSAK
jgi:hypothetical protein